MEEKEREGVMICAYCAKEYEGSVCPQCGGKAQGEENAIVCPYCDSVHTGGPRCANCGADLLSIFTPPPLPPAPVGRYGTDSDYMELDANAVTIHRQWSNKKTTSIVIPYSDIGTVTYKPAGLFSIGFLSVRRCRSWKAPVTTYFHASSDITTVLVYTGDKGIERVYRFLKCCAETNAKWQPFIEQAHMPPPDMFWNFSGYMLLGEAMITIHKMCRGRAETERMIPYHDIRDVRFKEQVGISDGFIALRSWDDSRKISETADETIADDCAIKFGGVEKENLDYKLLYAFLQSWAEKNRENRK